MRRPIFIVLATILCLALALGAVRRVGSPRLAFCGSTDEFSELMPGLRLHGLPLFNVDADIRSNFFKSLFYSPHGLGDAGFYYLASSGLYLIGAAVSDRHLWLASAFTNALLIVAVAVYGQRVARSRGMAYVAALLLALSPLYVFSSQTAFARVTFVPLAQVTALLLAARAHQRPGWAIRAALALAAFFIELTDGFYFGPVLLAFLFLARKGPLADRTIATFRDATFWCTAIAVFAGLAFDFALGALAAAHDTTLTLFGYVRIRAGYGGVLSAMDLLRLWMEAFTKYIPVVGPFVVIPAWLVTVRYALTDPVAGTLAVWLGIASAGVVRYYASATGQHIPGVGPLTAYPLALPSYLVVAWACGHAFRAGGAAWARVAACVACAAAAAPLAAQLVTERYERDLQFKGARYQADLEQCVVVKAASAYVREQAVPGATVFQLTEQMPLSVFGEFYYGLSYVGNHHTGERNRLIDFGPQIVGKRYTPEQLARAYGVPHFTFYVEFVTAADSFASDAVRRLEAAGARPALEIRDRGRAIGRVWRFDAAGLEVMEAADMSARWDRVGRLPQLFQQALAGTSYHFGASWPKVPE